MPELREIRRGSKNVDCNSKAMVSTSPEVIPQDLHGSENLQVDHSPGDIRHATLLERTTIAHIGRPHFLLHEPQWVHVNLFPFASALHGGFLVVQNLYMLEIVWSVRK